MCNVHTLHNDQTQVLNEASAPPPSFQQRRGSFRCEEQERGREEGESSGAVHMQSEILTCPDAGGGGGGESWGGGGPSFHSNMNSLRSPFQKLTTKQRLRRQKGKRRKMDEWREGAEEEEEPRARMGEAGGSGGGLE